MKLFGFTIGIAAASDFSAIIDEVNTANAGWTAGENFHEQTTLEDVRSWLGAWSNKDYDWPQVYPHDDLVGDIPATFDSRSNWSDCSVIGKIRDQGGCGSCWAFGAAEAISDRICIASKGATDVMYAAEDVLSCCLTCGNGCNGGYPLAAMEYFVTRGLVTGGLYGTKDTCQPYTLEACEHHVPGDRPPCTEGGGTPKCSHQCIPDYTTKAYKDDKVHGHKAYSVPNDVEKIQQEIMHYGPVEAAFTVYSDFPSYKSGVYRHTSGSELGGHAIKIIGWGTEGGDDYWLINNSWNSDWGDKGTFKILRGSNECGIEGEVVAATVDASTLPGTTFF